MSKGEHAENAQKFSSHIRGLLFCQQLFSMQSEHLGMGPISANADDEVWIISGCTYPMVLRRATASQGPYTVLGRAYVHGIMDGEVKPTNANSVKAIVLR